MNAYKKKGNLLFKRDGTCQVERLPKSLIDNNALIDERPLDEHIVFLYLYSDLIQYYESQDKAVEHNTWHKFLEHDDTVILSLILHTEITPLNSPINNDLLLLKKKKNISSENKYTKRLLQTLRELMLLINYWHDNLSKNNNVRLELRTLVKNELNQHITLLYGLLLQWNSQSPSEALLDFCSFVESIVREGDLWELTPNTIYESDAEDTPAQSTVNTLKDLFDVILSSLLNLQQLAQANYPSTLRSQQHKPQTALLIAFLRLLQYASTRLNHIPQRHLDFYYNEVLKFRKKPKQPDKTIVHFQLQDGVTYHLLPKGTRLHAGKDKDGRDILFKTERALPITQANLSRIHKVHQTIQLNAKEGFLPLGSISAATCSAAELSKLEDPQTNQKDTQQRLQKPFLGFVLASPILYLKEGHRDISLRFKFSEESFGAFLKRVKRDKEESVRAMQDRLALLFQDSIDVHLTTKEQWFTLPSVHVTTSISTQETECLEIILSLPPDIPPIVDFDKKVHDETYDLQTPAIRLGLKNEDKFGNVYLLRDLVLAKVTLEVAVRDYRGLALQNDLGLLDSSHPFQPFGPLPQLHGNFYIGSDEIFSKDLKSLKINIEWEDIPMIDEGWKSYYQGYPGRIRNEDFKVSVSYLNHRQWYPFYAEHRQEVNLFSFTEEGKQNIQKLEGKRVIDEIDLNKLNLTKTSHKLHTALLTPNTLAGFLRLELCGPDMAFGHSIYPSLVSQSFIRNANNKKKIESPTIKEPYTPLIKSLSVDYSAKEDILLTSNTQEDAEQYSQTLIRISPLGYKKVFPHGPGPVIFLSASESVGCFFCFGFEHLSTSLLALHVQVDESSIDPDKDLHKPTWQYLSYNDWIDFRDDEIIADETDGLSKSGIIMLRIPERANTDNTLLSSGLVWIRALFPEDLAALPELVSIHTQATVASRVISKDQGSDLPVSLSPGSIQGIVGSPPEVKSVLQPFPSFGGSAAENSVQFYTRASERLRHKNRAVSAWDYERLILERFPEIFRAKCVNHSSKGTPFVPRPGRVIIVVINKLQNRSKKNEFTPVVSKQLLKEIEHYLKSVSSPFVEFEVMGPTYEEVKVNVEVKLKPMYEKGIYLNRLQKAIRNFLSPWLFNAAEDVKLGGIIPSSKIIDFINKKEYVEGIGNFSILKYTGKGSKLTISKVTDYDNYLKATYPWSVMVSSDKHKISVVDEIRTYTGLRHGGVDDMGIGEDFVIGPWQEMKSGDQETKHKKAPLQESLEEYYLVTKKNIKRIVHGDS